ncbi:hypothetical protein PAECIP111893_04008 [Paenibacillus plantiphilus]|uniref:ATPase n=1 Tax=Paenibacillus plantiphilus TaxID=2905650 RepID=A0ABM9CKP0_9BACL|nr:hypothetical protein [Paenibacillus plantiphilus]CAH1215699.1 hypothetical protein PAECIP111893_04008 [Paenibacillus plantiphilus]
MSHTENVIDILKRALNRTVPITDPNYIIGEDNSIAVFNSWVNNIQSGENGIIGAVVLGQVGNGKTHFLRYMRREYIEKKENYVGIYVPDMFVGGPLVNALNSIYKSLFVGSGNKSLKDYLSDWKEYTKNPEAKMPEEVPNELIRYLLACDNSEEMELVLDYFSNKDLFPDQLKYLRTKFGAKKNFINNENDFSQYIGDALQFIQIVTSKSILLFFDEVDKVYSSETNTVTITRVGTKILSAYRSLFDSLNRRGISGAITVGATPEAWDVLSNQTAFERRFKDRMIVLKVPKTKEDSVHFCIDRLEEINYLLQPGDQALVESLIDQIDENKLKTWADVISNVRSSNGTMRSVKSELDPAKLIVSVLKNTVSPMTWHEILEEDDNLKDIYPKTPPTSLLTKLEKEGRIKINATRPRTYEIDEDNSNND